MAALFFYPTVSIDIQHLGKLSLRAGEAGASNKRGLALVGAESASEESAVRLQQRNHSWKKQVPRSRSVAMLPRAPSDDNSQVESAPEAMMCRPPPERPFDFAQGKFSTMGVVKKESKSPGTAQDFVLVPLLCRARGTRSVK